MIKMTGGEDFYPTPTEFLCEITDGLEWSKIQHVLEPSAGRGNIAEFVRGQKKIVLSNGFSYERDREIDVDCIEIEPELQSILAGKNFRVVHDDFLTFSTFKHYDLVFMNPPFSQGAKHLLKAIEVQKFSGGAIICILNAETIRNAYTNERKVLERELEALKAEITFHAGAFSNAENPTDVEVAVVKVVIPEADTENPIFEELRKSGKGFEQIGDEPDKDLTPFDVVERAVSMFEFELAYGLKLWKEYQNFTKLALQPSGDASTLAKDGKIVLGLVSEVYRKYDDFNAETYMKHVRLKYWGYLFTHPILTSNMTSNLQKEYLKDLERLAEYDFSYYNIKTIQADVCQKLVKGVEDCILAKFDELSAQHAYDPDMKNNIWYYDGWKTNCSWKINKKVILPCQAWDADYKEWNFQSGTIGAWVKPIDILGDLEKVFNYLDNGETKEVDITERLKEATEKQQSAKIVLKYFTVTFYKKNTVHITFTNERVLKKFNIYGSQKKGWLPKGYARQRYADMSKEEQAVIDSFEGSKEYNASVMEADYYLFDAWHSVPMLTA